MKWKAMKRTFGSRRALLPRPSLHTSTSHFSGGWELRAEPPGRTPHDCWMNGERAVYVLDLPEVGEVVGDECERDLLLEARKGEGANIEGDRCRWRGMGEGEGQKGRKSGFWRYDVDWLVPCRCRKDVW